MGWCVCGVVVVVVCVWGGGGGGIPRFPIIPKSLYRNNGNVVQEHMAMFSQPCLVNRTCVYTYDPETEKSSLQSGFFQVRGPHVTFKWTRSISKQMPMVVFAKSVHVDSVPLQERKTVTAEWYINTCLTKVFEAWTACHPNTCTRCLLLRHGNAVIVPAPPPPICTTSKEIGFS